MRADSDNGASLPDTETLPVIDERFGLTLGGHRYYINLRVGTEKRSGDRLAAEGQVRLSGVAFLYCVICSAVIMLFGTLCLLYLLKSAMGINLTAGDSALHDLFVLFAG